MSRERSSDDFKFEIKTHIGVLSEGPNGWKKELNVVSWNGRQGKYDIRDWDPTHDKMGRGITMTDAEFDELAKLIAAGAAVDEGMLSDANLTDVEDELLTLSA